MTKLLPAPGAIIQLVKCACAVLTDASAVGKGTTALTCAPVQMGTPARMFVQMMISWRMTMILVTMTSNSF